MGNSVFVVWGFVCRRGLFNTHIMGNLHHRYNKCVLSTPFLRETRNDGKKRFSTPF
jgi:hypothetical protein